MGTKNNPGEFDCYANADPDEPMFILLGRDRHAPTLIWLWAAIRELDGEDAAVVAEARQCVVEMLSWAFDHGRKSAGLGQATLVGVMELIRTVNGLQKDAKNEATNMDLMRRFLAETKFDFTEPAPSDD